jgi:hypothetical protein
VLARFFKLGSQCSMTGWSNQALQRTEVEKQLYCTARRMLAARYGCKRHLSCPPSLSLGHKTLDITIPDEPYFEVASGKELRKKYGSPLRIGPRSVSTHPECRSSFDVGFR